MITLPKNKIPITRPSISETEIAYVTDAIKNGWGEKCYDYIKRFEKSFGEYLGSEFSLSSANCTGSIHLALMALGIKAGDEVIVPEITWIASVSPVLYIGAKPVFTDVLPGSWCIDPEKIEKAITPKTKAIIVVHVYGSVVEMDAVMDIAKKHNLHVIEDAAESLGSLYRGKKTGGIGDAGVFSFHGTKTISTGEGGMLVTDDKNLMERARVLNDHGRDPKIPKAFWMEQYGYKYKMSNLQAAMGCAQIERADELVEKKRENFRWYKKLLNDEDRFIMNTEPAHTKNSYWMPTVIFDKKLNVDRDRLINYLKENNIDSRPFFYPLSSLPMFDQKKENTVSYDLYYRGINLPSHHDLTYDDVSYIADKIESFLRA